MSSRIWKAYDRVFENPEIDLPEKRKIVMDEDPVYFKKLAFEKYLMREIDDDELNI